MKSSISLAQIYNAPIASSLSSMPGYDLQPPGARALAHTIASIADETRQAKTITPSINSKVIYVLAHEKQLRTYQKILELEDNLRADSKGMRRSTLNIIGDKLTNLFNLKTAYILRSKSVTPDQIIKARGLSVAKKIFDSSPFSNSTNSSSQNSGDSEGDGQFEQAAEGAPDNSFVVSDGSQGKHYKIGDADISSNRAESIFNIISIRYMKTFIPKLELENTDQ